MTANVTIENLYWNKSLMSFFFRHQSEDTLVEVLEKTTLPIQDAFDMLDEYFEGSDIDGVEEIFYSETTESILEMVGMPYDGEEDDDEVEEC